MPSFGHTPETLLGRNDSRNPATTCKGITSSGRSCRRALGEKGRTQPRTATYSGFVPFGHEDGGAQEADLYCWQHKDQARAILRTDEDNRANRKKNSRSTGLPPLRERGSADTLAQRLGISQQLGAGEANTGYSRASKPNEKTETFQQRPSSPIYAEKYNPRLQARQVSKPKKGFWAALCFVSSEEDDYMEVVRHRRRVQHNHQGQSYGTATVPLTSQRPSVQHNIPFRVKQPSSAPPAYSAPPYSASTRNTNNLLSLIPQHCSPQTASTLLVELTKPISPTDEEGYIYIFWLTPQTKAAPPEATARSLLSTERPRNVRRISDVMTEFSYSGDDHHDDSHTAPKQTPTILLKIGRASNITRRMNEWQRQCGYALTLVRWYPHVPSSAVSSPQNSPQRRGVEYPDLTRPTSSQQPPRSGGRSNGVETVRKVPCVKRVERLIQLELAGQQVKRKCEVCGKEHREWFEVQASQAGVKAIDETVKRWVAWAERENKVFTS